MKYLDNCITLFASLMTFATITWELVRFRVHTSYYLLSLAVSGISSMAAEVSAKFEIEVFPDELKPKTKPRSTTTQGLSAANLNRRPRPAIYYLGLGPPSRTRTHCMTRSRCPVPGICQLALISCLVAVGVGDSHHGLRSLVSGSVKFIGQSPSL